MSIEARVGWAALIMGCFGVAAFWLWPDQRWIGWVFLAASAIGFILWMYCEISPYAHNEKIIRRISACTLVGLALIVMVELSWPDRNRTTGPEVTAPPTIPTASEIAEEVAKRLSPTKSTNSSSITEDIGGRTKATVTVKPKEESASKEKEERLQGSVPEQTAKTVQIPKPQPLMMDAPSIAKVQEDAKAVITEYAEKFADFKNIEHWWLAHSDKDPGSVRMVSMEWKKFEEDYNKNMKEKVLKTHRLLMSRITNYPATGVSFGQAYGLPFFTQFTARDQLKDLWMLLNEFESENGLPLTQHPPL